jgi:hypothetical protein
MWRQIGWYVEPFLSVVTDERTSANDSLTERAASPQERCTGRNDKEILMRVRTKLLSSRNMCAVALVAGIMIGAVAMAAGCGGGTTDDVGAKNSSNVPQGDGSSDNGRANDGGFPESELDASTSPCGTCTAPVSVCIDDASARYFWAFCSDAGRCEVASNDVECPPGPGGPACANGTCNMAYLR